MFLLHVFLTGDLSMVVGLNKMPLFWMICILIDVEQLLTLVCILLLIHNVHVTVKCEFISNVIAMHDAGTLHKAYLCQCVFVLFVFLIVLNVPGKTENFSLFCFLFRAINAVYRIHTRLATQTDWNLSRYPRGTTSCHTVRSYACAFIT